MEIKELLYHITYTLCFEFFLPPLMDWIHTFVTMNMTAEFILYTCLTFFFHIYISRLVRWINPSFNITAQRMLFPMVASTMLMHRFNLNSTSTLLNLKMVLFENLCIALLCKFCFPRLFHWILPSTDFTKEIFLFPILNVILEFYYFIPLQGLL